MHKPGPFGPARPRITYLHQHYKEPHQAGGTRSWEFARRLVRDGFTVTVIAGGAGPDGLNEAGVNVRYMNVNYDNAQNFATRIGSFLRFMAKATWVATATRSDVIFATSTPLTVAVPARVAASLRRIPYVFEVRDVWPKVPIEVGMLRNPLLIWLARRLEQWAYSGADQIVALSPGMKRDVLSISPNKVVHMVPNASDTETFELPLVVAERVRHTLGWDERTLVYAGSLGMLYDPEWLVRFAHALHQIGIRLVIYGTGGPLDECRRLALQLGLDPQDVLPGALPKDEIARRVSAAAIVVSSLVEKDVLGDASLNKVFDALAAGRPLVFNHGGWLADLCTAEGAGWKLQREVSAAAESVAHLLDDQSAVRAAGAEASRLAREMFDREELYLSFKNALEASLARPSRVGP